MRSFARYIVLIAALMLVSVPMTRPQGPLPTLPTTSTAYVGYVCNFWLNGQFYHACHEVTYTDQWDPAGSVVEILD